MNENTPTYDDEIDLVELMQTVWDGRWSIVSTVLISVLGVFGYQAAQPTPNFTAVTEIKPISSVEAERYRASNALGFFEITPPRLLNLYIEQLEERTLFEEAIRKYELLKPEDFEDELAFNEAVTAIAASIELNPPVNTDGETRDEIRRFWTIRFEYNDSEKWKQVLSSVNFSASQSVRRNLQQQFANSLAIAKRSNTFQIADIEIDMLNAKQDFDTEMLEFEQKLEFRLEDIDIEIQNAIFAFDKKIEEFEQNLQFELEDIDTKIENAKIDFERDTDEFELNLTFQLEDIDTKIENEKEDFVKQMAEFEQTHRFELEDVVTQIDNAVEDYERKTQNRLAFLKEQAAIARALDIPKNTIEAQTFGAQNSLVANVKTDSPFYLRGYEAIEKEIELINSRIEKKPFINGLIELEQKERELLQDKTLERADLKKNFLDSLIALEQEKRKLEQDKTLERANLKIAFDDAVLALEKQKTVLMQDKTLERADLRRAFDNALVELEEQKTILQQDKTLERTEKNKIFLDSLLKLENQKRAIEQNKTLQRAESLFASTPIMDSTDFSAVSVTVEATNFEIQNRRMLMLALAVVIGGMIGVFYVLIASAFKNRKTANA